MNRYTIPVCKYCKREILNAKHKNRQTCDDCRRSNEKRQRVMMKHVNRS